MSGIVGIVRLDGGQCDRGLLERMTAFQAFRGPHGYHIWTDGGTGFGHALFKLSDGEQPTPQPATLDGKVWITAHARIDGRGDLLAALRGRGHQGNPAVDDALLLLHAYEVWGEACLEHFIGDFTFAIWDSRTRRLFCAVDQLGIRPFYYTDTGGTFIFSNTLDCLRLYPGAPEKLDETAVGDFLLFGEYQDRDRTIYAGISRLAPAQCLTWSGDGKKNARRYWSHPMMSELGPSRPEEIVEGFRSLLDAATRDRVRAGEVAVFMSGGLDSPQIAAAAVRALSGVSRSSRVRAYTEDFRGLFPHEEPIYAAEAATKLGIEIQTQSASNFTAFDWIDRGAWLPPEPINEPAWSSFQASVREVARRSRIALTGFDGDTLTMTSLPHHWLRLARQGDWRRLVSDLLGYVGIAHGPPPIGFRTALQRWRWRQPPLPDWLAPDFVRRAGLVARWNHFAGERLNWPMLEPRHRNFDRAFRSAFFDRYDAGWTGCAIETFHPLMDLRIVDFFLRLPPVPWCLNKMIFRKAAEGVLPHRLIGRPKAPLAEDPVLTSIAKVGIYRHALERLGGPVTDYVDPTGIRVAQGVDFIDENWANLRPIGLACWLMRTNERKNPYDGKI